MPRLSKTGKEMLTAMMKESIFEAATAVLSEHGVDGTTMNRVAEAADLAKSSLYDYFPSKEDSSISSSTVSLTRIWNSSRKQCGPTCPPRENWRKSCGPASNLGPGTEW